MRLRQPNLTWRLRWWFVAIALVPLLSLWAYLFVRADHVLRENVATRIEALADSKAEQLENFVIEQFKDARLLANSPHVVEAMERLAQQSDLSGNADFQNELRALLKSSVAAHQYSDLYLVAPTGDELFSFTGQGDTGTNDLAGPDR